MIHKTFQARPSLSAIIAVLLLTSTVVLSSVVLSRQQTEAKPPTIRPQIPQLGSPGQETSEPNEETLRTRIQRASQLQHLGTIIVQLFPEDHDRTLPDSLMDIQLYCDPNLFQWAQVNVEYIGKGKILGQSKTPIAFDQMLLPGGEGTNVLFADSHVEYRTRSDLESLGIIDPKAQFMINWSIFRGVEDDKTLMAFLNQNPPSNDRKRETSAWTLSNEAAEGFRQIAVTSPQTKLISSPRILIGDRQLGLFKPVFKEVFLENGQLDLNRSPGYRVRSWFTKAGQDLVRAYVNWKIIDEISPHSGSLDAPVIISEGTCTVTSHLGDWVVVPGSIQGRRYFVMWRVTTPSRPIGNIPWWNTPSSTTHIP
jgi:prepilin-type processing-associated H-X9-DG protein